MESNRPASPTPPRIVALRVVVAVAATLAIGMILSTLSRRPGPERPPRDEWRGPAVKSRSRPAGAAQKGGAEASTPLSTGAWKRGPAGPPPWSRPEAPGATPTASTAPPEAR